MAGQGVGFDWIPSIRPDAAFIITLGDDRGIGSGGSLRGFANSSPSFLCAYQMSGSYPVLQRLLLYLLFLFGTIGMFTASSWMTGPFLGGAMAYSGSAAIHSIIILASSNKASQKGTIDLDGIPIFQILAVCLYLCAPLYLGSSLLQIRTGDTSATVLVVGAWAILIIVGFFCSIVVDAPQAILPCIPRNTTTSIGTIATIPADTDLCAELCASRSSLIRSLGEAQMNDARVTLHGVFKYLYDLGWFVGMACAIGVTAVIFATIMAPNSGHELMAALSECNDPSRSSSTGRRRRRGRRSNKSDSGPACIIVFILVAAPVALVIQIALGEHLLAKAALVSEKSYAVGQWGHGLPLVLHLLHPSSCF
ncbi:hypothetical protein B0H13DRAFT_913204 [Mycena leptocephala]|nr:hypothetical protein B0H13DRAFT_913204 [Mycena leptocephala]